MQSDPSALTFMYFVVPIWLSAGFADWLCRRAAGIEWDLRYASTVREITPIEQYGHNDLGRSHCSA